MKKIICCAIIAAMFFSLVPAHAAGGSCGLKAVKIGNSAGMEYASFEYRLADDCDGVSVNGNKLVISESAAAQNVLLEVICHP